MSGFDTQSVGYRGRLALTASHLPVEPSFLPTYQLAGPGFDFPRIAALARHLGIDHSVVQRTSSLDHQVWAIAAAGGPRSSQPLHSLAISRHTGEMIYHSSPSALSQPAGALNRSRAVFFARRWITGLGWPGRMPLLTATPDTQLLPPSAGVPWQVSFGWRGVAQAAETQATVIVMPGGRVIEARLWPPVQRSGHITTRSVQAAWTMAQTGAVPIVVQNMGALRAAGMGSLRRVELIHVLDTAGRVVYLIPAYRFVGVVHIQGLGTHAWSAVVPAFVESR